MNIQIIEAKTSVLNYVEKIQKYADSHKKALGFLPRSAYKDLARSGKLWAIIHNDTDDVIAFLTFGGKFPTIRVTQMFTKPEYRQMGYGNKLIDKLKEYGEKHQYSEIIAKVAQDLSDSHAFWEKQGFTAHTINDGGVTTKRKIVKRIYRIPRNDLFAQQQTQQEFTLNNIPLSNNIYVLDVNVLYDIVFQRQDASQVEFIIKEAISGDKKIFLSKTFIKEIYDSEPDISKNPIAQLAQQMKVLSGKVNEDILGDLQKIIFPNFPTNEKKSRNSKNDIQHLAECISNNIDTFITRDKTLLNSALVIEKKYRLRIISPFELIQGVDEYEQIESFDNTGQYSIRQYGQLPKELIKILPKNYSHFDYNDIFAFINDDSKPLVLLCIKEHLGIKKISFDIFVADNRDITITLIDMVFYKIFNRSNNIELIEIINLHNSMLSTALDLGFLEHDNTYVKILFDRIIMNKNWCNVAELINKYTNNNISDILPDFNHLKTIGVSYLDSRLLSYDKLRRILYPSILIPKNQEAIILPIKPEFAEYLFPINSAQFSLFPSLPAKFCAERAYFRSMQAYQKCREYDLIFFYVSGKQKEMQYVAQITKSQSIKVDEAINLYQRQGVLSHEKLTKIANKKTGELHLLLFKNLNALPNCVSYSTLKKKSLNKQNFQAPNRIDYKGILEILES